MKKKLWRVVFAVWVFFWAFFLVRGFVKGEAERFRKYAFAGVERKKEYILKKGLYDFLEECKRRMPEDAAYRITGDLDDHNKYRVAYYLYPRTRFKKPEFILDISPANSKYLLKRVK
jgi:hypothetical protein